MEPDILVYCPDCGTARRLAHPCPRCGRYGEVLPGDVAAAAAADEPLTVDAKERS